MSSLVADESSYVICYNNGVCMYVCADPLDYIGVH